MWAMDFVHDALYRGRPYRTLNVLDERNREAWPSRSAPLCPRGVIRVVEQVIALYSQPAALRLDNGPELRSQAFADWCAAHGIALRFIQPGKPHQNAFIERFNRTYRHEVLAAYVFDSLQHVRLISEGWMRLYNEERPHRGARSATACAIRRASRQPRILQQSSVYLTGKTTDALVQRGAPGSPSNLPAQKSPVIQCLLDREDYLPGLNVLRTA
jgi:putative transposase